MTHPRRLLGPGTVLAVGLLALAGCTGSPADRSALNAPSAATSADLSAPEAHSAVASPEAAPDDALPHPPTAVPSQSSGSLGPTAMPAAADLGVGWEPRVEGASDGEDGVGNGTPFQARDPHEVVETTIPMGCAVRSPSPVPGNVLQATYTHRATGAYAVVLRMRFTTAEEAQSFLRIRQDDLRTCLDQPEDPYSGAPTPVLTVTDARAGRTGSTYRQIGDEAVWYSLAWTRDRDVVTLDANPPRRTLVTWERLGSS